MVLIFGGAYQGKSAYAHERFGTSRKIIKNLDREILAWIQADENMPAKMNQFINDNMDAVILFNDISCGVVPIDPIMRKWREEAGRLMSLLAQQSEEVTRLYCGIPTRLK